MIIPHSKPSLTLKDHRCLHDIFQTKMIAQHQFVRQFEKNFSTYHSLKDAVALNSGTAALHLALLALDVQQGDEVIIPSYVCTALLNAVHYTQAKPVIVDVLRTDGNICPAAVKQALTSKTKAVIVPHMFGIPADIRPIKNMGVPIIEDCAQALGSEYRDKKIGQFGTISIFSFYATKVITTGEGGMLAANNTKLINRVRDLRDYDNKPTYRVRFNYKLTDLQAKLGLNQFSRLDTFLKKRRAVAKKYDKAFLTLPVERPQIDSAKKHIDYRYIIRVEKKSALLKFLQGKGIQACSPVFRPLHACAQSSACPQTTQLMRTEISLPIYPDLTAKETRHIIQQVVQFYTKER